MRDQEIVGLQESYSQVYAPQELEQVDEANKLEIYKNASPRQRVGRRQARDFDKVLHPSDYDTQGEPVRQKTHEDSRGVKKEEVDIYDTILSHLIDEGFASDEKSAEAILGAMSEGWRDVILTEKTKKTEVAPAAKTAADRAEQQNAVGAAIQANPKAFADAARKEAEDRARRHREHLAKVDKNNR